MHLLFQSKFTALVLVPKAGVCRLLAWWIRNLLEKGREGLPTFLLTLFEKMLHNIYFSYYVVIFAIIS